LKGLNRDGSTAGDIHPYYSAVDLSGPSSHGQLAGQPRHIAVENRAGLSTDDSVKRAAHADIAHASRPPRQDAGIRRLNMCVCAQHRRGDAIEVISQSYLFAGRFRMEIDEERRSTRLAEALRLLPAASKRILRPGLHERATLQTEHAQRPGGSLDDDTPDTGSTGLQIKGAQNAGLLPEPGDEICLIPRVIAQRDDIDPLLQKLARNPRGNPPSSGGILPIDDDGIRRELTPQLGQKPIQGEPSGFPHHIPEKEEGHHLALEPQGTTVTGILAAHFSPFSLFFNGVDMERGMGIDY